MNYQDIIREEYDTDLKAQKTSLVSASTIYAVVNTSAGGDPKTFIGLTTSVIGSAPTIHAVVNTAAAGVQDSLTTINAGPNQIGSVTISNQIDVRSLISTSTIYAVVNTSASAGNVTLDPGSKTQIIGNLTLSDSKGYIGLVSVSGNVGFSGNVTLDAGSKTQIIGNVTLSDSKNFIGLVTATANVTLNASKNWIGLASISGNVGFAGNVTLDDGSLTGLVAGANYIGLASVQVGVGAATIGIVRMASPMTIGASANWIGLTTTVNAVGTSFIGLVTAFNSNEYASNTIFQGVVSGASGVVKQFGANTATWLVAKADNGNATTVFVGPSLASVNVSFPLDPGEAVGFSVNNSNLLYMCGTDTFSSLRFTGGN